MYTCVCVHVVHIYVRVGVCVCVYMWYIFICARVCVFVNSDEVCMKKCLFLELKIGKNIFIIISTCVWQIFCILAYFAPSSVK